MNEDKNNPYTSGTPSRRITYPKAVRLAAERIARKRGLTSADDVIAELFTVALEKALDGDMKYREEIIGRMWPEPKEQPQPASHTNVFVLDQGRRDAIYQIAAMHNGEERSDRSLGTGDQGGEDRGV